MMDQRYHAFALSEGVGPEATSGFMPRAEDLGDLVEGQAHAAPHSRRAGRRNASNYSFQSQPVAPTPFHSYVAPIDGQPAMAVLRGTYRLDTNPDYWNPQNVSLEVKLSPKTPEEVWTLLQDKVMNKRTIHLEHPERDVYTDLMKVALDGGMHVTYPGDGLIVGIRYDRNHALVGIPRTVFFEDSPHGDAARYVLGKAFQGYHAAPDLTPKEALALSGTKA